MKRIGLFLDDERASADVTWVVYPQDVEWVVVRNSDEFFQQLQVLAPVVVSFDHDIQEFHRGEETTGYNILKEMIDIYLGVAELPQCFFHTQNPIGKKNMECYYENALKFQMENSHED